MGVLTIGNKHTNVCFKRIFDAIGTCFWIRFITADETYIYYGLRKPKSGSNRICAKDFIFYQDKAGVHTVLVAMTKSHEFGSELLLNSPY